MSIDDFRDELVRDLADVLQKYHIQEVTFVPATVLAKDYVAQLSNMHTYQTLYLEREKIKQRFQEAINATQKQG